MQNETQINDSLYFGTREDGLSNIYTKWTTGYILKDTLRKYKFSKWLNMEVHEGNKYVKYYEGQNSSNYVNIVFNDIPTLNEDVLHSLVVAKKQEEENQRIEIESKKKEAEMETRLSKINQAFSNLSWVWENGVFETMKPKPVVFSNRNICADFQYTTSVTTTNSVKSDCVRYDEIIEVRYGNKSSHDNEYSYIDLVLDRPITERHVLGGDKNYFEYRIGFVLMKDAYFIAKSIQNFVENSGRNCGIVSLGDREN